MIKSLVSLIFIFQLLTPIGRQNPTQIDNPIGLSQLLLKQLKNKEEWKATKDKIESFNYTFLEQSLNSDSKKFAFWINIYNAYIQIKLIGNSELYEDRSNFFSEESIEIGELDLSFDTIEHDILRKAEWKYGFGWVKNPFLDERIEGLQPSKQDSRIHFALNCGAKSCPKVSIYSSQQLDRELDENAKQFLEESSSYDVLEKTVYISPLFNWFRGDFGDKEELLKLLKYYGVIPTTVNINIEYNEYDWTLALNNYAN